MKSGFYKYESQSYDEIQDLFHAALLSQLEPKAYPEQFLMIRKKLVEWIIIISQKLYFKPETMHRTIYLFDSYIANNKNTNDLVNIKELKLILIAFLSISIKLNELNANYIHYLCDSILNGSGQNSNEIYSCYDLAMKELSLPALLNYNITSPNVYHFNTLFIQIALNELHTLVSKEDFVNINNNLLKYFLMTDLSVTMSPVNSAIIILNETLKKLQEESGSYGITQQVIIGQIQNLIQSKNDINEEDDSRVEEMNDTINI